MPFAVPIAVPVSGAHIRMGFACKAWPGRSWCCKESGRPVDSQVAEPVGRRVVELVDMQVVEPVGRQVVELVGRQVVEPVGRQVVEPVGRQVVELVDKQVVELVDKLVGVDLHSFAAWVEEFEAVASLFGSGVDSPWSR